VNHTTTGTGFYCNPVSTVGANSYTCEWNPPQEAENGWYNATILAEAYNYWANSSEKVPPNTFYLFTQPKMLDANITPRDHYWGGDFNFTVKVKDNLGDLVNVTLQTQVIGQGWEDISNSSCTSCSDNPNNYTLIYFENVNYSCAGYAANYMKFRFLAEDNEGYIIYTDVLSSGDYFSNDDTFYLDTHNITIEYFSGNETTATPSNPSKFILRGYDLKQG